MTFGTLIMVLGLLFVGLLVLALFVWAVWVRAYVRKAGARTASPYTLVALVVDLSTSLIYSRGRLPWSVRIFATLLFLLVSDLLLATLLLLFGRQ